MNSIYIKNSNRALVKVMGVKESLGVLYYDLMDGTKVVAEGRETFTLSGCDGLALSGGRPVSLLRGIILDLIRDAREDERKNTDNAICDLAANLSVRLETLQKGVDAILEEKPRGWIFKKK